MKISLKIRIIILVLIGSGLFVARASAEELNRSFTVVPPTIEQSVAPGERTEGSMKVINDSENELTFEVSVHDFIVDNNEGIPNLLPLNTLSKKYSGASFVGVAPTTFTIKSHDRIDLHYYLQVPSDARPGGRYTAVVFTPTTNVGVSGTGASVQTKIGTLFYIGVKGEVSESALVNKFLANSFQEYGPVKVSTQIKNLSDIHIKPGGFVVVSDMMGNVVSRQALEAKNIFPMAARDYENAFGQKYMLGRYKATLDAEYGSKNSPLSAVVYFWVIPWKIASAGVLVLAAFILFLIYKKNKKAPKTVQSQE